MATVQQSIRVDEELVHVFDQLAQATGRSRNQLYVEALRFFAQTEGWQITEVRRTLAGLDGGSIETLGGEELIRRFLDEGRISEKTLSEAEHQLGIPQGLEHARAF